MAEDQRRIELKVAGMTCAMCARTIEHSLRDLDGTTDAEVNLGNETVRVEYDLTQLKLTDLEKAVTDVGYEVVVTIKVGGMTCVMCAGVIEDALTKLDGITGANVNLSSEKAYITYNPYMTMVSEMKKPFWMLDTSTSESRGKKRTWNKLRERRN